MEKNVRFYLPAGNKYSVVPCADVFLEGGQRQSSLRCSKSEGDIFQGPLCDITLGWYLELWQDAQFVVLKVTYCQRLDTLTFPVDCGSVDGLRLCLCVDVLPNVLLLRVQKTQKPWSRWGSDEVGELSGRGRRCEFTWASFCLLMQPISCLTQCVCARACARVRCYQLVRDSPSEESRSSYWCCTFCVIQVFATSLLAKHLSWKIFIPPTPKIWTLPQSLVVCLTQQKPARAEAWGPFECSCHNVSKGKGHKERVTV